MKDASLLVNSLKEMNIELSETQIKQFEQYYDLLVEWNSFMNLTAITDWDEVIIKHFVDSLSIVRAIPNMTQVSYSLIDVGTGAGFPGIPIKIAFPNIKVTLLDSLNKRVNFLNEVISVLGLKDIEAIHGRAEDFGQNPKYRESYDLVVSRAVANMAVLCELCLPYSKVDGKFISYKSEKVSEEIENAKKAISTLSGNINGTIDFMLPNSDIYRSLLIIDKIDNCPKKYPRKAGTPSKSPIA